MSGGRWDPQTRIAVVVVGMLVVAVGTLSTVQWRSGPGAAALVIGGLLVALAGVAGGTVFGPRESTEIKVVTGEPKAIDSGTAAGASGAGGAAGGVAGDRSLAVADGGDPMVTAGPQVLAIEAAPSRGENGTGGWGRRGPGRGGAVAGRAAGAEIERPGMLDPTGAMMPLDGEPPGVGHAAEAGQSHEAGDTESAVEALVQQLRASAPYSVAYHDAVVAAVAAAFDGRPLRPTVGQVLGPLTVDGLPVAVDIRAGTGFSLSRMRRTYRRLFDGPPPVTAILVVVNTDDRNAIDAVVRLREELGRPLVVAPWQIGDPVDAIVQGVARIRRDGAAAMAAGMAPPRQAGRPAPRQTPDPRQAVASQAVPAQRQASPASAGHQAEPLELELRAAHPATGQPEPHGQRASGRHAAATPAEHPPAGQTRHHPAAPAHDPPVAQGSAPQAAGGPRPRRTGAGGEGQLRHDDAAAWRYASDLHWRGQLQEAEDAYRAIVDARGRDLGWDHVDTLTARDQHATVLRDLERLAEALVECDEVLTTRGQLLGDRHPDTLTSRSHLATIYHQTGDLTRAEAEHRRVLEARSEVLGPRHAETLISRSNLAKVYQDLGELDQAIAEHRTVQRDRAEALGAEHRDTLMSQSLLASALHQAGRLDEAEQEHRKVLQGRLREFGPTHLDTAVSRHRLASVLHDLNRLEEAVAEYRTAREVYAHLLGASSPFARAAASDLALAERALRHRQR